MEGDVGRDAIVAAERGGTEERVVRAATGMAEIRLSSSRTDSANRNNVFTGPFFSTQRSGKSHHSIEVRHSMALLLLVVHRSRINSLSRIEFAGPFFLWAKSDRVRRFTRAEGRD